MMEKNQIELLEELMERVDCGISQFHHEVGRFASEVMKYIPGDEVLPFNEDVTVETWNKGYNFTAKGIMKRKSDDSIMIVGEYFGREDRDFLSYVCGYKYDKAIFTAIKDTLRHPPMKDNLKSERNYEFKGI